VNTPGQRREEGGGPMKRHRDDGLRKLCACSQRKWSVCTHPWYFSYKAKGKPRVRVSLDRYTGRHIGALDEAKGLAATLRAAVNDGTYPPVTPTPDPPAERVTFATAAERFWKHVPIKRGKNQGKPRGENESQIIGRLCAWTPPSTSVPLGQHSPTDVTEDVLEAFIAHLHAQGRAASTISNYIQVIKALDRWLALKGYRHAPAITSDADGLRRPKAARRDRRLVPDTIDKRGKVIHEGEERRLLAAASPWLQRLIIAAIETGCRRGELLGLRWAHVDLTRGELTVTGESNKTGQGRQIPIAPRLRAVLDLLKLGPRGKDRPGDHYVFGDAIGQAVASTKKGWETALLRAHGHEPTWTASRGLSAESRRALRAIDLHFHDLRHEAGSRMLEAGWPLHHVQRMLGHADVKQTAPYLNAERVGLHESMKRYGTTPAWQSVAKRAAREHPSDSHADQAPHPQPTVN
jgi:integrase